jgi:DNA-binding helix-hairpin-helix protein with protein kinase domain
MMIEYPDVAERRERLAELKGIEGRVWVQVEGFARVRAIADEDLERETEDKTSSVHFLRFDIAEEMARALKQGAGLAIGVDHPRYTAVVDPVPSNIRNSLVSDLS